MCFSTILYFISKRIKLCILMSVQQEIRMLYPSIFTKADKVSCYTASILNHLALYSHRR